jgi:DNA-binding MarR family transcriptional regulator
MPPNKPLRLTDRQREVYNYYRKFIGAYCEAPTLVEAAEGLGVSTASVCEILGRLEQKGWITRRPRAWRGVDLVDGVW